VLAQQRKHALARKHTHTHSCTHTHTFTHARIRTHARTHAHTHTHSVLYENALACADSKVHVSGMRALSSYLGMCDTPKEMKPLQVHPPHASILIVIAVAVGDVFLFLHV